MYRFETPFERAQLFLRIRCVVVPVPKALEFDRLLGYHPLGLDDVPFDLSKPLYLGTAIQGHARSSVSVWSR